MRNRTVLALCGALVASLAACSTGAPAPAPPAPVAASRSPTPVPVARSDPAAQLRVAPDGRAFRVRDVVEQVFLDVTRDLRGAEPDADAVALGRAICRALARGDTPAEVVDRLVRTHHTAETARRWVDDATLLCPDR